MKKAFFALSLLASAWAAFGQAASEITINLKLDYLDFLSGERIRGIVDVVNVSPDSVSVGYPGSPDRLFVEVFRASDRSQLERSRKAPYVAPFTLHPNEGQKLETFLGDHYGLRTASRYLARPVLVHKGVRYEGQMRAFDVVPGIRVTGARQMFANQPGLSREIDLVSWSREGKEHLFVRAHDAGASDRQWNAVDLGPMMKITRPTVSVMPTGEVIILHRVDPDNFVRSEFWSVPDDIEFASCTLLQDPETAGSNRVRELYKESGGVKPAERPWWKFW